MEPQSSIPVSATPPLQPLAQLPRKRRSKAPIFIVLLLIVLAGIGGLVYAGMNGIVTIPYLTPAPPALPELSQSFQKITTAEATVAFDASVVPLESGVTEISKSVLGDGWNYVGSLPSDLTIQGSLTADGQRDGGASNGQTTVTGSFASGGFSAAFDGSARFVNGDVYVQVNKLPIPFIDVASLDGAWVKIPGGFSNGFDVTSLLTGSDPSVTVFKTDTSTATAATDASASKSDAMEEVTALLTDELQNGALTATSIQSGSYNDQPVWDYTLKLDEQKFVDTYNALYDARVTRFPDIQKFVILSQKIDDAQESELQAIVQNTTEHLLVSKSSRLPIGLQETIVLAPSPDDAPKLAGKEIKLSVTVSLEKVNQAVSVEVPDNVLSLKQAYVKLSNKTEGQVVFEDQIQIVQDLRAALLAYYIDHGSYPASLSDLVGQEKKTYRLTTSSEVVANIPNDQYTQAPFVYTLSSKDGYHLIYTLRVTDASSSFISAGYADGVNTATPADNSLEGSDAFNDADDDHDGLTNGQEFMYGTNPEKADSDGDGFTDKQEIDSGHDPLSAPGTTPLEIVK